MLAKRLQKETTGQAMAEFVIVSIPLIILLTAIIFMCDSYIIKQKTIVASRYGSWKMAENPNIGEATVKANISTYFFPQDTGSINFSPVSQSDDFPILSVSNAMSAAYSFSQEIFTGTGNTPLKVNYAVSYQKNFTWQPMFKNMPRTINISASHEVDSNCWNAQNSDIHELMSDGSIKILKKIASFF